MVVELGMLKSENDLIVWRKSIELVKEIYKVTSNLPHTEVYGLSSQMRRSAISIPSNISEGRHRKSTKEFIQFLHVAYGSAAELETQLIISEDIYNNLDYNSAGSLLTEIKKMLNVLIEKLEFKLSSKL